MSTSTAHRPMEAHSEPSEVLAPLARHARERPRAAAIREMTPGNPGRTICWAELHERVGALADRFRGLGASGNVVLLSAPNSAEFIAAFLAVLHADAVVMPVHPRLAPPELRRLAQVSGAAAVIGTGEACATVAGPRTPAIRIESLFEERARPGADELPAVDPSRPGLLLQSSGTTGMPRIAVRSRRSLGAVAANVAHATGLTPDDEVLACIPLCHSYGVENGLLAPLLAGCCVRILDGFDPHLVPRCLLDGVTVFPGVPFMFEALARPGAFGPHQPALTLRLAYSAGGRMPSAIAAACEQELGLRIGQLYGATEIGSVTFNSPSAPGFDPGCVGEPMRAVRALILDPDRPDPARPLPTGIEGHVAVCAPSMLTRYLDGEAPILGGYFLTGDLGRVDRAGRLWISGRVKLQIDVGGLKVNPGEVELALLEHPAVADCAVVALPLSDTIARVRAVVVPRTAGAVTADDLRRFLGARLAPYKVPRVFEFRGALPRSPLGKVLRKELEQS